MRPGLGLRSLPLSPRLSRRSAHHLLNCTARSCQALQAALRAQLTRALMADAKLFQDIFGIPRDWWLQYTCHGPNVTADELIKGK
jgi:hypothetical protein